MLSRGMKFVFSLLVVLFAGCGRGETVTMIPVSGTILFEGKPLEGAYVTFFPEAGPRADGTTDESGKFHLMTHQEKDGTVAGSHRVAITKLAPTAQNDPYASPKNMIPERYSSPRTSELVATVKANELNEMTFELQK